MYRAITLTALLGVFLVGCRKATPYYSKSSDIKVVAVDWVDDNGVGIKPQFTLRNDGPAVTKCFVDYQVFDRDGVIVNGSGLLDVGAFPANTTSRSDDEGFTYERKLVPLAVKVTSIEVHHGLR